MKVLNLYACLGGNRFKWDEVAKQSEIEIEVTAVELDEEAGRTIFEIALGIVNKKESNQIELF